jgi:hypothetical protein
VVPVVLAALALARTAGVVWLKRISVLLSAGAFLAVETMRSRRGTTMNAT